MSPAAILRMRIIHHLRTEWRFSEGGSSWRSFRNLADELREDVKAVRREVRRMKREGRLVYSWLCDQDGVPCGSGYLLTEAWERFDPLRHEDPDPKSFDQALREMGS